MKESRSKVYTYKGSGDGVVRLDDYPDWFLFEIEGNAGNDYFGVIAYDETGDRIGSLVNTTEKYNGRVYDSSQSAKMLEVKAKGDWTIKMKSLYTATGSGKGDTIKGPGDDVIVLYTDKGKAQTADITGNRGEDYFGIVAYDGWGERIENLVNTTDAYSGTVMLKESPRIFEVMAEGEWTISFE